MNFWRSLPSAVSCLVCADRLTSSKSYRKKVVTSLTHDKLLRIFSKDHLRGYRLGIRGKRLLRERAPERFQFYLSGHTDTNSIKSWDWIGDAHDRFAVGDQILVRVTEVNKTSQEELSVHADVKSVTENTSREALKRCRVQSKYAGRVTDVHKGIVYVRLSNGVNAVAHSCYDRRTPGKKDDVSFVVTKLDEERSIAVGIITRIIRQNL